MSEDTANIPGERNQQRSGRKGPSWIVQLSPSEELFKFAKWAFGPEGFPKLLILVYGDFCDRKSRVLFYRNSLSAPGTEGGTPVYDNLQPDRYFRILSRNDEYLLGNIEGASEFLNAG